MTAAELRAIVARHRVRALRVAAALVVLVASLALGMRARRQLGSARVTETRLRQSAQEIADFRAAFKPSTPEQEARLVLPDSLAIAIPHDLRMSLAGQLASEAERLGLAGVRVHLASADSSVPPPRPDFANHEVNVGEYTIAIDCSGSFAQVLSFVNHLPPSTALQRITAGRAAGGANYHLVFAVLEADRRDAGSGGGQHG